MGETELREYSACRSQALPHPPNGAGKQHFARAKECQTRRHNKNVPTEVNELLVHLD